MTTIPIPYFDGAHAEIFVRGNTTDVDFSSFPPHILLALAYHGLSTRLKDVTTMGGDWRQELHALQTHALESAE